MLPGGPAKRAPKKKRSGFKPSAAGKAYAAPKYTPAPSRSDAAQRTGARTPKPKPYRPTPKQVEASRIQAKAYRSQGKAVKKVAHVQKAQGVGRPTGGRTLVTRVEAARKAQRGKRREREAKAITKLVGFDPRERYGYTPRKTKYNVMPAPKGLSKAAKLGYLETNPRKLKAAGFAPPGWDEKLAQLPAKAALNAPKEAMEIAITTPTTIAHDLAVMGEGYNQLTSGHPEEFAKAAKKTWVDPAVTQAKEVKKDPIKYIGEHPVTTALTVLPAGRAVSLGAGRVARSGAAAKVASKTRLPVHQPPERPPARLRGTTLKQVRPVKRGAVGRAREIKRDRREGAPQISTERTTRHPISEADRRVDEFVDLAKQREQAAVASKARKINEQIGAERAKAKRNKKTKGKAGEPEAPATFRVHDEPTEAEIKAIGKAPEERTPKEAAAVKAYESRSRDVEVPTARSVRVPAVRKATREQRKSEKATHAKWVNETLSGARGGAAQATKRDFAREVGSHWEVIDGVGGKPAVRKYAPADKPEGSGKIHADRADAELVAKALKNDKTITWEPEIMKVPGKTEGVTAGYAVVPKQMLKRLERHERVGVGGFIGAPGLRVTSRTFRKAVLPTSTKWLGGQVAEGALRSMAHGGSPFPVIRYARGKRYIRSVERTATEDALKAGYNQSTAEQLGKRAADQVRHQAVSSGQFSVTGPAAEYARGGEDKGRTLKSEFEGTDSAFEPYAEAATRIAAKPGVRHIRGGYRWFAEGVFNDINGPIERYYKTGMLGKEVKKQSPLLENKLLGLSEKALDEAARGHRGTAAQTNLARGVMRAYGKYSQFEPAMRDTILHSTPFLPWMINMTKFLGQVMPVDHPLKTSLLVAHVQADQEWRKANGLSLYSDKKVPDWLLGSVPSGKGKYIPVGRFGPFAPGDPIGAIGNQYLPQLLGMYENTQGRDWKGDTIPGGAGRRISNTLLTGAESMIPLVGPVGRLTGLENLVRGKKDKPTVIGGTKEPGKAVLDFLNPLRKIETPKEHSKKKPKRKPNSSVGGSSSVRGSVSGGSSVR